ncbi:MFS general substrate transporter [Trametes cingulata]|nr:MFS general substrate transporter [Trametes cingulata]
MSGVPSPNTPQHAHTDSGSIPLLLSRTQDGGRPSRRYSPVRRYVLLLVFCLAQLLDAFHNSALLSAAPRVASALGMSEGKITWLLSAYQLSFASFLLLTGRLSDLYDPKLVYVGGMSVLGMLSIGSGFVSDRILLIFMRALMGIAGSMTIPSALALLTGIFTEPSEQAIALGAFAGFGAIGNVLGLTIGAIFAQCVSWRWAFWLIAFIALPIVAGCTLIPASEPRPEVYEAQRDSRWRGLGAVGALTVALLAFLFSVTYGFTSGPSGWGTPGVLVPLIVSIFMVAAFFYHESTIPTEKAAIPPRTWFLRNFSVLVATALMPLFWWTTVLTIFVMRWQEVWHWSAVSVSVHLLPLGLVAFALSFTAPISRIIDTKWIILLGEGICAIGTLLLPFANVSSRYWPFVFPALILGSGGAMLTYMHALIAIFRASPASMAGTVGAVFNVSLQLGAALGISLVRTIKSNVEAHHGGAQGYDGCAAAFWFLLAVVGVECVVTLVFHRREREVRR